LIQAQAAGGSSARGRAADGHDAKVAVHGQLISGSDEFSRLRDSRHAGDPVLARDDRAVDEHPAATLDNALRERAAKVMVGSSESTTSTSPGWKS
jgi:hypothetical protein